MIARSKWGISLLAIGCLLLSSGELFAQKKGISVLTGGTGGVYYPMEGGSPSHFQIRP